MKHTLIIKGFILLAAWMLISCTTKRNQMKSKPEIEQQITKPSELIYFSRGICYGKCPEFELRIFDNGLALLHGKSNLSHIGMFEYHLSDTEMKELNSILNETDFQSMDDEYSAQIADVPSVGFKVLKDGVEKQIGGNYQFPEPLLAVFKHLDNYVFSEKWLPAKNQNIVQTRKSDILHRIIVNLEAGTEGNEWVKKYNKYDAFVIKKIAPRMQLWLISYDINKIDPLDFLDLLKSDKAVIQAEFDKKLEMRDKGRNR
jgi:hypothetical protein